MQIRKTKMPEETTVRMDGPGGGYEQRVLSENDVPGLCRLRMRNTDGERTCCYQTGGLTSLREAAAVRRPDAAVLLQILEAVERQKEELTAWLIGEDCLLLDPDLLFFDADGAVRFCAYPGDAAPLAQQLAALLDFKLETEPDGDSREGFALSPDERESLLALCLEGAEPARLAEVLRAGQQTETPADDALPDWVERDARREARKKRWREGQKRLRKAGVLLMPLLGAGAVIFLLGSGILSGFSRWIRYGICAVTALFFVMLTLILREAGGRKLMRPEAASEALPPPEEELPVILMDDTLAYEPENPEETDLFARGETVLLADMGAADRAQIILISLAPEQRGNLYLKQTPCRIGKLGGGAQVQIESSYLSRDHAVLEGTADGCRVRDEGSTNGTFLNGDRLMPHQWYPLQEGDELRFADAAYRYRRGGADAACGA